MRYTNSVAKGMWRAWGQYEADASCYANCTWLQTFEPWQWQQLLHKSIKSIESKRQIEIKLCFVVFTLGKADQEGDRRGVAYWNGGWDERTQVENRGQGSYDREDGPQRGRDSDAIQADGGPLHRTIARVLVSESFSRWLWTKTRIENVASRQP